MGRVNRSTSRGAKRAPTKRASEKRVTNNDRWVGATVTPSDVASRNASARNQDALAMVARATQWVEVCARRNAVECSSQQLRLYVPAAEGGSERNGDGFKTRKVKSLARNKTLRNPNSVGHKAADYAEMAGDVEEVLVHPILDLLRKPNPWQLGTDFMHLAFYALEVAGNRYWHVVQSGQMVELYPMSPQYVRVIPHETEFLSGYVYGRNGVVEAKFMPDEVQHQKFLPSLSTPYYGVGPLAAMFGEADLDAACLRSESALWNNGARPDWSMTFPAETSQQSLDVIESKLEGKFRGPSNRGRFLLTTGAEPKPLQFTAKEMEYIQGIANIERRIWAAFGLPESELRLNDANLASSVSGNRQYLRQTIKPRVCAMAEYLTEMLLPLYNIAPGEMFFAYDEVVPGDEVSKAATMTSLVGGRILTRNEARAELGYEPMEGGDEIDAPPAPFGGMDQTADTEDTDGAEDTEDKPATGEKVAATVANKGLIQTGINIIHSLLGEQAARSILAALNSIMPEIERDGGTFDTDKLTESLSKAIDSFALPAMNFGATTAGTELAQAGATGVRVQVTDEAVAALRRRTLKIAGDTSGNVADSIKESLARAIESGGSREDAIRAVSNELPDRNAYRAEMIADTEISRSYHAGNAVAYKSAGIDRLEWLTVADPCPVCEAAAREWNAKAMTPAQVFDDMIDGAYATPTDPRPPQHPRCRCELVPVIPADWGKA